jgi:DNA-binding transcriptional LysR family regulator
MIVNVIITGRDMIRNLDVTALRSFVAIADLGGVTRAAGQLNLTQSAVSMQIKRLEEVLQVTLLDRSLRRVSLTASGEQLLGYARKMLAINDEALGRLMHEEFEGDVTVGVPHDIVYPVIPGVLRNFARDFPKMRVRLVSSFTKTLLEQFSRGECDMILTTEDHVGAGGETLAELPLVWIGAPGGQAWRRRPLPLAFEHRCVFRQGVQAALENVGIPWAMAVESDSTRTIEASVMADLAVHTSLAGCEPTYLERIDHGDALPDLMTKRVNLYVAEASARRPQRALAALIREAYSGRTQLRSAA